MKRNLLRAIVALVAVAVLAGGGYWLYNFSILRAYDASMAQVYDLPLPAVAVSTDAAVIARGKHLVDAIGCSSKTCHGADLGGGEPLRMGALGTMSGPNITTGGLGSFYSAGETARLLRQGVKRDGRSVTFMPVQNMRWLPDDDLAAIVSYLKVAPSVGKPNGVTVVNPPGKMLDRKNQFVFDVARRIDHQSLDLAPPRGATAEYGAYLTRMCTSCHGDHLSGGSMTGSKNPIVPLNLTPDASGLKDWSFDDFNKAMRTGVSRGGRKLNPMMPIFAAFDDTEMHAIYASLMALAPRPLGAR